jgi:hypothetical protein
MASIHGGDCGSRLRKHNVVKEQPPGLWLCAWSLQHVELMMRKLGSSLSLISLLVISIYLHSFNLCFGKIGNPKAQRPFLGVFARPSRAWNLSHNLE